VNYWDDYLIPDMRRVIVDTIDPLSARFLGLTSKSNWKLTQQSRQREKYFNVALFGYGTRRLLTKYLPDSKNRQFTYLNGLYSAAITGNSVAMTWILHRLDNVPVYVRQGVLEMAFKNARFNIIRKCISWCHRLTSCQIQAMVESGRGIEIFQFLEKHAKSKPIVNDWFINVAAWKSEMNFLEWAYMKLDPDARSAPLWWTLPSPNLKTLKWCYERSWRPTERSFQRICIECTPDVLDWLLDIGYPCKCNVSMALRYGKLDNAKWLYNHGSPFALEQVKFCAPFTTEIVTWLVHEVVLLEHEKDELFGIVNRSCDISHMQILRKAGYAWRPGMYEELMGLSPRRVYAYWKWLQEEGYHREMEIV